MDGNLTESPKVMIPDENESLVQSQLPQEQSLTFSSSIHVGDFLNVQRSNGSIESGWLVTNVDDVTQTASVIKIEGDTTFVKRVPVADLQALNPHTPEQMQTSELSPEVISNFRSYVNVGGQLIREGRFEEAIRYFKNSKELEKIGKYIVDSRAEILNRLPTPQEIERLADFVALNSWNKKESVDLASVIFFDPSDKNRIISCPAALSHEIALIYLEEWLHSVQDLIHSPLTGCKDFEVDVAVYMDKQQIPMTQAFLRRYGRKEALDVLKQSPK